MSKAAKKEAAAPAASALSTATPAGPCAIVILGASGDLTKRKLVPALHNLLRDGLVGDAFAVVGVATSPMTDEKFREKLRADATALMEDGFDAAVWGRLEPKLHYVSGDFGDKKTFEALTARLADLETKHGTRGNALFYLAIGPGLFETVVKSLSEAGLLKEANGTWRRVIVEKPFGHDLESAKDLNAKLRRYLSERQIYRIDHYLGKETVQNVLAFRFANGIFEPVWNRRYVDHVQITVAETLGVEGRGKTYEQSGALRDMIPNHIFQLLSLTAMEPPISFDADAVRDEQTKVMRAIVPMSDEDVLRWVRRGQYGPGVAGGKSLPAYRSEANVSPTSNVETYVAMRLMIDSWRWTQIPFYIRVGKALKTRATEIVVQFKRPPLVLFRGTGVENLTANTLVIRIQPSESIALRFGVKQPGASVVIKTVPMDFRYADHFGARRETGYERLLYDAMCGDPTLFQRADMVEAAWSAVQPILNVWGGVRPADFPNYAAGSWGPASANQLLSPEDDHWHETGT